MKLTVRVAPGAITPVAPVDLARYLQTMPVQRGLFRQLVSNIHRDGLPLRQLQRRAQQRPVVAPGSGIQGAKPRFARSILSAMRLRASAANSDGIGRAGRLAAKTARLHNGNALAMPTAAVSLRKSRRCIFTSFYSAGEYLSLNPTVTGRSSRRVRIKIGAV